jgi:hypothetical protein
VSLPELDENLLILYQSSEGSDLRRLRFTGNTAYVCALDGEWFLEGTKSLLGATTRIPIPDQSARQLWRTILLINNEIDMQLRDDQTV